MPTRRALSFDSLEQVMPEVDRLQAGYTKAGQWSLGQACNHLTKSVVGSIDGFDFKGPWLLRKAVAPAVLRWVLRSGKMPEGVKVAGPLLPRPEADDRAEAEALRAAVRLFAAHTGPVADHPFFGRLTREQLNRLHCIHCAHHLSFLLPGVAD